MLRAVLVTAVTLLFVSGDAIANEMRPELRQCIVETIPTLDDGLSPADTVADATISECWDELQQRDCPDCGEAVFRRVLELLRPRVTAEVAKYRAARRM
jgi:hypothetical protein